MMKEGTRCFGNQTNANCDYGKFLLKAHDVLKSKKIVFMIHVCLPHKEL